MFYITETMSHKKMMAITVDLIDNCEPSLLVLLTTIIGQIGAHRPVDGIFVLF